MRTFALMWHPLSLFTYVHIFMVLTGLFNFCRFFQPWFFVLMAKIGSGFFIVGVWTRVQFLDNAKYSLSSQQNQINSINPKLLLCCSWSLVTSRFFKLSFTPCKAEQPLREMELQEKEKDGNQRENLIQNPVY